MCRRGEPVGRRSPDACSRFSWSSRSVWAVGRRKCRVMRRGRPWGSSAGWETTALSSFREDDPLRHQVVGAAETGGTGLSSRWWRGVAPARCTAGRSGRVASQGSCRSGYGVPVRSAGTGVTPFADQSMVLYQRLDNAT